MKALLHRVTRRTARELRYRCRDRARIAMEALRFAGGRERWRRERLHGRLTRQSAELGLAGDALARSDWPRADAALRSHFMARRPRFVIAPAERAAFSAIVRRRFPGAEEDARRRATRILRGEHDLLGYERLSLRREDDTIDWHLDPVHGRRMPLAFWTRVPYLDARLGDHKIIWEINRHQHWLTLGRAAWLTGDDRYARAFVGELESWMRANPPLAGINWASMLELAFRSLSWLWALHLFTPFESEPERPWLVDLLLGLDTQLDHIARHLSLYFSPNTHLLGEGLALYVAGCVLPELASAKRWEEVGRGVLVREARAQVNADGGHAELSAHYHRYALDFYLLALAVARRTGDPVEPRFAEVAFRMASFCRALAGDDGLLPTIGDDDGGMLFPMCGRSPADASDSLSLAGALLDRPELAVGEAPEEVLWMLGGDRAAVVPLRQTSAPTSRLFAHSGYAVLRSPHGHAILDVGRHGFLNGGHAHADALSLVLSVHGRPLLIDPGTATYTTDRELRDRFRSTAMHNTVVINGRSQSLPAGPFHWKTRADARVDYCTGFEAAGLAHGFACIEASHDGYLPLVHRRTLLALGGNLWLIADHILGSGDHRAEVAWHFHPAWTLVSSPAASAALTHTDGLWAGVASTAGRPQELHGDSDGLGWYAPLYGQVVPSPTLRFSNSGAAPLSYWTAIAPATSPLHLSLQALRVLPEEADGWHRAGVLVSVGDDIILTVLATPAPQAGWPARDGSRRGDRGRRMDGSPLPAGTRRRPIHRTAALRGELRTDARVAVLRFSRSGEPLSLDVTDGSAAEWTGRGSFTLGPSASAGDLHFDLAAPKRLSSTRDARPVG